MILSIHFWEMNIVALLGWLTKYTLSLVTWTKVTMLLVRNKPLPDFTLYNTASKVGLVETLCHKIIGSEFDPWCGAWKF